MKTLHSVRPGIEDRHVKYAVIIQSILVSECEFMMRDGRVAYRSRQYGDNFHTMNEQLEQDYDSRIAEGRYDHLFTPNRMERIRGCFDE